MAAGRDAAAVGGDTIYQQFLRQWSITFCPRCGLRRFNGRMALDPYPSVVQPCRSCDLDAHEMTQPLSAMPLAGYRKTKAYYITRREEHWPRYDSDADRFIHPSLCEVPDNYASRASMLHLTKEEAESLTIVKIFVESSVHRRKLICIHL